MDGKLDGQAFTSSNDEQWQVIQNTTSKLFYATGNYEDHSADFEKKLKVHESTVAMLPSTFGM